MTKPNPLDEVLWRDSEIESLNIDYDEVRIVIRETTGRHLELCCEGYIGYGCSGFWDEVVIEKADVMEFHPFVDKCVEGIAARLGSNPHPSGNNTRNNESWKAFVLRLIDGAEIVVACGDLSVRPLE
jgi:hypothetical protein